MKNIWKYILAALAAVGLEWVFLALFTGIFNGLSPEAAVVVGVGFFLAFEIVICTCIIFSKIGKSK